MCRATFRPISCTFSFVFYKFSCKTAPSNTYTPHPGHSRGGDITKGGLQNTHGGSLLSSSNTILPTCTCVGNETATVTAGTRAIIPSVVELKGAWPGPPRLSSISISTSSSPCPQHPGRTLSGEEKGEGRAEQRHRIG